MSLIAAAKILQIKRKNDKEAQVRGNHLSLHLLTAGIISLLLVFSSADYYLGRPINCSVHTKKVTREVFTDHCRMSNTYSIPLEAARPVARHQAPGERRHQAYYQWVSLALLLQGLAAGLPVGLWRRLEAGKLTRLLGPLLQQPLAEAPVERQVRAIATFLRAHPDWYREEAFACLACEILALLLTLGQVYAMDLLLGGQFVALLQPENLATVFPRVVGCSMSVFGFTASVEEVSGICTLNFNAINEKIYAFLWVWFLLLALASALQVGITLNRSFSCT